MIYYLRQGFRSALQARAPLLHIANGSYRAFSSTPVAFRGVLPEFLPSSSPELASRYDTLTRLILFPRLLTPDQAALAFRPENAARLEAEPIEITLGQVTLPLVHIDVTKDIPRVFSQLNEIIGLSKTPADWENVLKMLEGFNDANMPLNNDRAEFVIRKLGEAGMHALILKAVQRGKWTGVLLNQESTIFVVLNQFRSRAEASGWDVNETKKMLSMAEQVVETMESPDHLGRQRVVKGDLRANPLVICPVAELVGQLSKSKGQGDADGKAEQWATRLVSGLRDENENLQASITQFLEIVTLDSFKLEPNSQTKSKRVAYFQIRDLLAQILPVWSALKVLRDVLKERMPEEALASDWERKLESAAVAACEGFQMLEKSNWTLRESDLRLISKIEALRLR